MDSFFERALNADLSGDYKNAIDFYIKSVEHEELCLDAHLNLAVILIQIGFDYGLTRHLILNTIYTEGKINKLSEYLDTLLQKTSTLFISTEIDFWKYYKENYFSGLSRKRIEQIIDQDPSNLVPYFQLYIDDLSNGCEVITYRSQIELLKKVLNDQGTLKNKYILSLIESGENQLRQDREF